MKECKMVDIKTLKKKHILSASFYLCFTITSFLFMKIDQSQSQHVTTKSS